MKVDLRVQKLEFSTAAALAAAWAGQLGALAGEWAEMWAVGSVAEKADPTVAASVGERVGEMGGPKVDGRVVP